MGKVDQKVYPSSLYMEPATEEEIYGRQQRRKDGEDGVVSSNDEAFSVEDKAVHQSSSSIKSNVTVNSHFKNPLLSLDSPKKRDDGFSWFSFPGKSSHDRKKKGKKDNPVLQGEDAKFEENVENLTEISLRKMTTEHSGVSEVNMTKSKVRGENINLKEDDDGTEQDQFEEILRQLAKDAARAAVAEVKKDLDQYFSGGYGTRYVGSTYGLSYATDAKLPPLADPKPKISTPPSDSKSPQEPTIQFPQPSSASPDQIAMGCAFTAGMAGTILGTSLLPSLWLAGGVTGALYGGSLGISQERNRKEAAVAAVEARDADRRAVSAAKGGTEEALTFAKEEALTKRVAAEAAERKAVGGTVSQTILYWGTRLTILYLKAYDFVQGMWFMYKTGQLSYQYMQTYKNLDDRFQIQDKMDAWNKRFKQGKVNFDRWEKENEVGRKILAGLRAVVLVEETSLRRAQSGNKRGKTYQMRAFIDQTLVGIKRFSKGLFTLLTGGGSQDLRELYIGIKVELSNTNYEDLSRRIGSAFAALVGINLVGAFFTVAPSFLASVACIAGLVWPQWMVGFYEVVERTLKETAAKGRVGKLVKREQELGSDEDYGDLYWERV
eukprot:CAMPEP_0113312566 /NCGR_PEP_ID=MMETSP0010_2-20120614/9353_1 /TAXON_ID=216773 ORGANISM="Corethron hystrix, Strain 308" /NCGR_SAMPLE_ID=MMETSP0010_2 /ASSEMBLY_ACC=CAM_ASM_000155 /LENGTH=605 /DNA_ID=CAMNT_0000168433 /DNA_START=296 /DNA_END=2112 /DNA_ORIENTATION=- /assembly_acc=CAM_ASM_000155